MIFRFMKIVVFIILSVVAVFVLGIYILIPSILTISSVGALQGNTASTGHVLYSKAMWTVIAGKKRHFSDSPILVQHDQFWYASDTFSFDSFKMNALYIKIRNQKGQVSSELSVLSVGQDSIVLRWAYELETSNNPFTRIQQYRNAIDTKNNMAVIISRLQNFLSDNRNIYGYSITQASTKDTFLISTKEVLQTYPSTEQVYALIDKLRQFAKENEAEETSYPMMNVSRWDSAHYSVMIALPVNKKLDDKDDIVHKQMVPGHFLITTVAGGSGNINKAYAQMQQYFQDYNRTSMAIPFMYLVTDRRVQTDSSKWITKLYFPVM